VHIAVVGSGPSGYAALLALSDIPNVSLTLIDTGMTPKSDQGFPSGYVSPKSLPDGDLPFRRFRFAPEFFQSGTNIPRSFAKGGLSLAWGATMLPFLDEDCADWHVKPSDLVKCYEALASQVWISGDFTVSSAMYPDFGKPAELSSSPKFRGILARGQKKGNSVFPSRVAVKVQTPKHDGCIYCNKCLSGCSYSFIWNSKDAIDRLNFKTKIEVIKAFVSSYSQIEGRTTLDMVNEIGSSIKSKRFDKIFLACGPLETFRICGASGAFDQDAEMRDSAIRYASFFTPFVNPFRADSGHSLTQAALRLGGRKRGYSKHIQFYDVGEDLVSEIKAKFDFLRIIPNYIIRLISKFFTIGIVYFHSAESSKIRLSLNVDGTISSSVESRAFNLYSKLLLDYARNINVFFRCGMLPLPFILKTKPGSGVHFGGWAPMGTITDRLGRLRESDNVHLVDSSVFQSIPAGPITYTIMANSYRIARESVECAF
jgi:ferredoxin